MFKIQFIFGCLFLMLFSSCGTSSTNKVPPTILETVNPSNRIAFINYNITKGDNGALKISVINKIITEGKLKGNIDVKNNNKIGFSIVQLDLKDKPISVQQIENPLIKVVEFVDDEGRMGRKKIELDEATFSIRVQLYSNTTAIGIKTAKEQSTTPAYLITTKI